jgi:TatD DNase family protein
MRLFDAHNHLQDERWAGRQEQLVAEARVAGVARMVVNGSCEQDWPAVAELARRHPDVILPSFGYHPWYLAERSARWEESLRAYLDATPAAVGEIGLDRWKKDLPWEGQEAVFVRQLRLAAERNLPVSLHCLRAWGPLVEILEREPRPSRGFLLHSYGGSVELVERLAPLGAYFSLPGYFAHERKTRQAEVFRHVPPDRLLLETDAPDQPLPDARIEFPLPDGLNHPANLRGVYAFAADLLGESVETLARRVRANFERLFGG